MANIKLINNFFTLYLNIIMISSISHCNKGHLIDEIIDKAILNLQVHHVKIYIESPRKLSLISELLLKQITRKLSSFVFNSSELMINGNKTQYLRLRTNVVSNWFSRQVTRIILIDTYPKKNVEDNIVKFIQFIVDFTPKSTRPKCIFFIINIAKSSYLLDAFKFAWMYKFLDVTVIEIIQPNRLRTLSVSQKFSQLSATLHSYNPFNNVYKRKPFILNHEIYANKYQNLYGYPIQIGFRSFFPGVVRQKIYSGKRIWDAVYGVDVSITNILSNKLNFSLKTGALNLDDPKYSAVNLSHITILHALKEEKIDFFVNTYYDSGYPPMETFDFQRSTFLYSSSIHLVVKQYRSFRISISDDSIIAIVYTPLFIIVYTILMSIDHIDQRIWSLYQILQIIVGSPVAHAPKTVLQRIIFIIISWLSIVFTTEILHNIFYVKLDQDSYIKFHTIQDFVDSGIKPTLTKYSKMTHSIVHYPALQKLLSISKTIDNNGWESSIQKCVQMLINDYDNVRTCDTSKDFGMMVVERFSKKSNKWIINIIPEPFAYGWNVMLLTKTSPYVGMFNNIFRRLFESGIVNYLLLVTSRNFTFDHKEFFGDHTHQSLNFNREAYFDETVLSSNKIALFYVSGCLLSFAVFICEILWTTLKIKVSKNYIASQISDLRIFKKC